MASLQQRILNTLEGSPLWYSVATAFAGRKAKVRFHIDPNTGRHCASESGYRQIFSSPSRGFRLYKGGVSKRGSDLAGSYLLTNVEWRDDGVVVDCGANYGDLWIYLSHILRPENYIAIEPNPIDFDALKANLPLTAQPMRIALGNHDGVSNFFVNSNSADSSIIAPPEWEESIEIQVKRLDTLVKELQISRINLFKLEAEGFEPEILEGAEQSLGIIDFIACDGGPERGTEQEQTMPMVVNELLRKGFEVVEFNFKWRRVLLRRVN